MLILHKYCTVRQTDVLPVHAYENINVKSIIKVHRKEFKSFCNTAY